jgi:hypothetical protein
LAISRVGDRVQGAPLLAAQSFPKGVKYGWEVRGVSGPRGKYRFRLKASNGEIVASGEAYESKASAKKGCEAVQHAADGAAIFEVES